MTSFAVDSSFTPSTLAPFTSTPTTSDSARATSPMQFNIAPCTLGNIQTSPTQTFNSQFNSINNTSFSLLQSPPSSLATQQHQNQLLKAELQSNNTTTNNHTDSSNNLNANNSAPLPHSTTTTTTTTTDNNNISSSPSNLCFQYDFPIHLNGTVEEDAEWRQLRDAVDLHSQAQYEVSVVHRDYSCMVKRVFEIYHVQEQLPEAIQRYTGEQHFLNELGKKYAEARQAVLKSYLSRMRTRLLRQEMEQSLYKRFKTQHPQQASEAEESEFDEEEQAIRNLEAECGSVSSDVDSTDEQEGKLFAQQFSTNTSDMNRFNHSTQTKRNIEKSKQQPGCKTATPNKVVVDQRKKSTDSASSRRGNFSPQSVATLKRWLANNLADPFPSSEAKKQLAELTGLSYDQVQHWFINARMRYLKPEQKAKFRAERAAAINGHKVKLFINTEEADRKLAAKLQMESPMNRRSNSDSGRSPAANRKRRKFSPHSCENNSSSNSKRFDFEHNSASESETLMSTDRLPVPRLSGYATRAASKLEQQLNGEEQQEQQQQSQQQPQASQQQQQTSKQQSASTPLITPALVEQATLQANQTNSTEQALPTDENQNDQPID